MLPIWTVSYTHLNKVPGFDPLKFLRHKVSRKTNEEMLQLELPYQKLWFRLRHPQGRMIRPFEQPPKSFQP